MKNYKRIILPIIVLVILLGLLFSGCTTQSPQGWSGCTSNGTNIYYGSMDSRIICINPDSRSRGLSFPDKEKGEWYSIIRGPTSAGGFCGFGCAPSGAAKVAIYSTPVFSGELIYLATYFGKVHAFNAVTGSERWIYPRQTGDSMGALVGNLLLVNDTIYVTSSNGYVYALEKEYGDKKWEFNTGSRIWTTIAYADGTVYVGNYDGKLIALSASGGTQIWSIDLPASSSSSPVIFKDKVIIGAFDHNLYAFNRSDGKMAWQFAANNWFWADVIVKDNVIYACSVDNYIYALNGDSGELLWEYDTGTPLAAKPILFGDLLIAVTEKGELFILNSLDGGYKQKIILGNKIIAPLYILDNTLYAHGTDDNIYAVDLTTEQLSWKFKAEAAQ